MDPEYTAIPGADIRMFISSIDAATFSIFRYIRLTFT